MDWSYFLSVHTTFSAAFNSLGVLGSLWVGYKIWEKRNS